MAESLCELIEYCCWEIKELADYCNVDINVLKKIGYSAGSVFASSIYIASSCPRLHLLGASIEEEMIIREWIEFYCSRLRPSSPWQRISKDRLHSCIEKLDSHLSSRVYITGLALSIADILLYYGLYYYMTEASYSNKLFHSNISRWFDQVQHSENVKPFTWRWISFPKY